MFYMGSKSRRARKQRRSLFKMSPGFWEIPFMTIRPGAASSRETLTRRTLFRQIPEMYSKELESLLVHKDKNVKRRAIVHIADRLKFQEPTDSDVRRTIRLLMPLTRNTEPSQVRKTALRYIYYLKSPVEERISASALEVYKQRKKIA